MIYLPWMGSTAVEPPLFCVNRMEFFLEFEQNDATNVFLDSAGNWDFTCRTTSALATTSTFSGSGSGLDGRYGFPNSVEGNSIYIPVADAFKLPNANWTFGLWCKTITAAGGTTRFLMGNVGATATDFQAYLAIDGVDNQYHFYCTTDGAVSGRTDLDSTHNPHATDWTLLAASLDRTNNQMVLRTRRVGGSTVKVSTAFAGALYTGSTTANFCINDGLSSDSTYFSGNRAGVIAAEKAFYTLGPFTDADFDAMFNNGLGSAYDDWEVCTPATPATLLLHFDGADGETSIVDSSSYARTLTGNDACKISTTRSKWGSSSLRLIRTLNSKGIDTGLTTDFSRVADEPWWFDFWIYYEQSIFEDAGFLFYFDDNTVNQDFLSFYRSTNKHLFYGNNTPGTEESPTATAIAANQWVHVGIGFDGTTVRRFHDGVQVYSRARTTVSSLQGRVSVGGVYSNTGTTDDGVTVVYMDEFRFLLGSCPYTSDFTPPTGPY